ncbi:hypothetical protein KQX54_012864 [Cotesia glomerata]|uniref:Uncharacterized protein n=1 Tax=Cotesia glomerata TaxID=32391 RepID=A0AAV7IHS3_COTGL|nr:hypothetical protein KQX54_012864 [Cotesia glomerata]
MIIWENRRKISVRYRRPKNGPISLKNVKTKFSVLTGIEALLRQFQIKHCVHNLDGNHARGRVRQFSDISLNLALYCADGPTGYCLELFCYLAKSPVTRSAESLARYLVKRKKLKHGDQQDDQYDLQREKN